MKSFKLQRSGDDSSNEKSEGGQKTVGSVLGLLLIIGAVWYFWGGGIEIQTASNLDDIHRQVISDTIQQYEITKRSGNRIDTCVHAGLVAASYLQANDESGYRQWKGIESVDCAKAGVPTQ